ncbi:MAG: hypothetical protein ISR76_09730 [Planctomycetes bacterium]|nr:hypothetical protein [Planctomycetota bacterium]MBL7009266.1 hypothetical protein [Planctomycetota bacterium]
MRPLLLALLALTPLPSCVLVLGAAIGAGVVHATSEDSVEVLFEHGFESGPIRWP